MVITADINDTGGRGGKACGHDVSTWWRILSPLPRTTSSATSTLFQGLCAQYVFISSASAYQKPPASPVITESTPLANPYWEYSRNKIACEQKLMKAYRKTGFPVTIVRPSHTYGDTSVPMGVHGKQGQAFRWSSASARASR